MHAPHRFVRHRRILVGASLAATAALTSCTGSSLSVPQDQASGTAAVPTTTSTTEAPTTTSTTKKATTTTEADDVVESDDTEPVGGSSSSDWLVNTSDFTGWLRVSSSGLYDETNVPGKGVSIDLYGSGPWARIEEPDHGTILGDVRIQAQVSLTGRIAAGGPACSITKSSMYVAAYNGDNGTAMIVKVAEGGGDILATSERPVINRDYSFASSTMRVRCSSTRDQMRITMYNDNQEVVADAVDHDPLPAGSVGFGALALSTTTTADPGEAFVSQLAIGID